MSCNLSRNDVITIVKQYITNYSTYLEGELIPCSDDLCDRLVVLEALTNAFNVTDGTTTESISSDGGTLSLLGDANKLITVTRSAADEFTVSIDTSGTSANEVFTVDGSGNVAWVSLGTLGAVDVRASLIVSKSGNDTTGTRNSWNNTYQTIKAAYDDSEAGDIILVYPGTYTETSFTVAKNTHIKAYGDVTIVTDITLSQELRLEGYQLTLTNTSSSLRLITATSGNIYIDCYNIAGDYDGFLISHTSGNRCFIKAPYITNNSTHVTSATLSTNSIGSVTFDCLELYIRNTAQTNAPLSIIDADTLVEVVVARYLAAGSTDNIRAITLSGCPNANIDIYSQFLGDDAIDIINSTVRLKVNGGTNNTTSANIMFISGSAGTPTTVLLYDSHIQGDQIGGGTIDLSGVVVVGQDTGGTDGDYVDFKILNSTIINKNVTATAQALSLGGNTCGVNSNIQIWFQGAYLQSGGTNVLSTGSCGAGNYANLAVLNYLNPIWGNKPLIATNFTTNGDVYTADASIPSFELI